MRSLYLNIADHGDTAVKASEPGEKSAQMSGDGSGRHGGRLTVDGCYRLNIESLARSTHGHLRGAGQIT
jgi:hypothetical protein